MDVEATLRSIIAEHVELSNGEPEVAITESTRLEDLGLDSLALLEIVFEVEEQLGIELPFDAANREEYADVTVGDLLRRIEALRAAK